MNLRLLTSFLFLSSLLASGQQTFHFTFTQPFGKYPVGLKVVNQYDPSRPFANDTRRPIQTLVWYPAKHIATPPMPVGDYEKLIETETTFDQPTPHGPSQDFVQGFMTGTETLPTVSVKDAPPEHHKFPLVLYAPSRSAPNFENIELCEYLASNGFVVIAGPSLGATTRHMETDAAGAAAQRADVLFLTNYGKTLEDVDAKKIAVIGYSWGGNAALAAAQATPDIRALVALDASFRYDTPASTTQPSLKIPLLFFSRGETPLTDASTKAPILDNWTQADLYQVRMLAISHIQFSTLYQRSDRFKKEGAQFVPAGYSLEDGDQSYDWIARYAMEFLKATLENDRKARAFLARTPAENGVPQRLMATNYRPAATK